MNTQYKIFYSWQSDDKSSQNTLNIVLQNAVDDLSDERIKNEIDYSTLGEFTRTSTIGASL